MDAIELLDDQHREVLDLIPRVISALRDSRRELFDRVADLLAIHATLEELHFYPAVRAAAGQDEEHFLYRSLEEHLQAKRLLSELLGTAVSDPTFEAKLEVLRDELEHHIEEERDELFAAARRVLDEEQREGLGQEMTATFVQMQKGRPRLDVPLQTRVASPLTPPPPAQGTIVFPRFARFLTIPLQLGARVTRFLRFLGELRPPQPQRRAAPKPASPAALRPRYSEGVRLVGIYVYPVKSCRGIAVDAARVVERGLEHDRRWMIVDSVGKFLTQRELPSLQLITTALEGDAVRLTAAGAPPLALPLRPDPSSTAPLPVRVWRSQLTARRHAAGSDWLSSVLARPVSLVWMDDAATRATSRPPRTPVSFADGYPFLVTSNASLHELNRRLAEAGAPQLTMERFRPNLVLDGDGEPFVEDELRRFTVGAIPFRGVKPCDRCRVTTVDPETAATGKEPLRTLATFRARGGAVYFGMNLAHLGRGELRVGDPVTIEERGPIPA